MQPKRSCLDESTLATIERVTRDMLAQIELQIAAVLAVPDGEATRERCAAILAELAETRGRVVRLRARFLGAAPPRLAAGGARDAP